MALRSRHFAPQRAKELHVLQLVDARRATTRRGRPSDRLAIDPAAGAVVGLEFGREHLVGVVLDAVGSLVQVADALSVPRCRRASG